LRRRTAPQARQDLHRHIRSMALTVAGEELVTFIGGIVAL
jgi:hypothetical protein